MPPCWMLLLSGNEPQKKIRNNLDTQPHCPAPPGQIPAPQPTCASPSFHLPAHISSPLSVFLHICSRSLAAPLWVLKPPTTEVPAHPEVGNPLPATSHTTEPVLQLLFAVFWHYSILPFLLLFFSFFFFSLLLLLFTIPSAFSLLCFVIPSPFYFYTFPILSPFLLFYPMLPRGGRFQPKVRARLGRGWRAGLTSPPLSSGDSKPSRAGLWGWAGVRRMRRKGDKLQIWWNRKQRRMREW